MTVAQTAESFVSRINWEKVNGLVPAIVQDFISGQVLMMGYMNPEALEKHFPPGR